MNQFKNIVLTLSFAVSTFLLHITVVHADTVSTNFENFTNGSVDDQNGWSVDAGAVYDQEVVNNTYGYTQFGSKVWRLSNKVASGAMTQMFSSSVVNEVGESTADNAGISGGNRQNHFEASFDFASTTIVGQDNLTIEVSPDRGDGARMSRIGIADHSTTGGLYMYIFKPLGQSQPNSFGFEYIKTNISRNEVHNLKYVIDVYDGPSNDVLKVYLDNILVYTGVTWEDYYYYGSESIPNNSTRTMDSLLFRAPFSGTNTMTGILVDNINIATSNRYQEVWVDDVATNGDGSEASPFNTIVEGVTKVHPGGTVHIAPGAYTETVVITKALKVQSTTDAVLTGSMAISSSDVIVTGLKVIDPTTTSTGTVNLSSLMANGSGEFPEMTVTSALNTVLTITADTNVVAPGWDGILHLPTVVENSSITAPVTVGQTTALGIAISVGSGVPMSFDKGVRLLFLNEAGKRVGYAQSGGTLTEITDVCSADTQIVGDALVANGNCAITVGNNLVVWTKHFTTFATFSTTTTPSVTTATRVIGSSRGGSRATTAVAQTPAAPVVQNTPSPVGQILGQQTYAFTINQKLGARGHTDVKELQKLLNKQNFVAGIEDGVFGSKTQSALKAFQKSKGLNSDGVVGPMTRTVLNK